MLTHDLAIGYAKPLISNINLTLHKNSLTCLVGANGIGKTTFLRTLAGLQRPLSGVVEIDGNAISTLSPAQISRLVSVVLTDKVADSLITVYELVAMGRMPYTGFLGRLSDDDQKIVSDAISRLGIDNISDCRLQEISDGQRQRAFIARALAQQTRIIILDEPTAFLDFRSRAEVMELLQNLAHNDGKSVLLSTHELDLAKRFGDCFWLMEEGAIINVQPSAQSLEDSPSSWFREIR
ncbi:MAG: ABC transporter ATP-binding protein [Bacteroidales bacterium]|nr:ABC transporter ATP-binding protein [Bacteroidales bacterium]